MRDIYLVLRRHWIWLVVIPVTLAILTGIYALFIARPVYKAETTLSVQTTTIQSRLEDRIVTDEAPVLSREQIETIALSRPVLDSVLKNQPDGNHARDATDLAEQLKVKFVTSSTSSSALIRTPVNTTPLVSLEVRARTAQMAAEIANLWAKATLNTLNQLPLTRISGSIGSLQQQLPAAEMELATAEKELQEFTDSSTLALDQATLDTAIGERSQLNAKISDTTASLEQARGELSLRRGDLTSAQSSINLSGKAETDAYASGLAAAGTSLTSVQQQLRIALTSAEKQYRAATDAQRSFGMVDKRALLQARISASETRLVQINGSLQSYDSRFKTAESRLAETRQQIAQQPKLITLEREITADPTIAAAIRQNNDKLSDLVGLKLQNQELNPVYQSLLQTSIQLQTDLKALVAERDAMLAEQTRLTQQIATDRAQNAALDQQAKILDLQLAVTQQNYQSAQVRFNRLSGVPLGGRTLDTDQPEYQRLRSLVSDLEANVGRLASNLASQQARASELDKRITALKQRVSDGNLKLANLNQNLELARAQRKVLDQKLNDLRIERASSSNLAQVLLPAFAPTRKANSALLPVALALVLGLLIGLIVPFLIEALRDPKAAPRRLEDSNSLVPASAD